MSRLGRVKELGAGVGLADILMAETGWIEGLVDALAPTGVADGVALTATLGLDVGDAIVEGAGLPPGVAWNLLM
jgi:hypothetical protein